ncbi:MAG: hypothetical protein HC913_20755, partial [Microscillaceae bacterium]|nr:hypothetical protein [Microscillaceae bacterium]
LAAILNSSMYTYKVAGPQVLVEMEVVRKMLEKLGYSEGEGAFAPGGSMANFTAMLVARNEFQPDMRQKGFAGPTLIAIPLPKATTRQPKTRVCWAWVAKMYALYPWMASARCARRPWLR